MCHVATFFGGSGSDVIWVMSTEGSGQDAGMPMEVMPCVQAGRMTLQMLRWKVAVIDSWFLIFFTIFSLTLFLPRAFNVVLL